MADKKLALIIEADQGYIRNVSGKDSFSSQNNILFYAISNTYIPLLNMFSRLESEDIPFKVGLVISPVLCFLLDDPQIQKQYIDHLDNLIKLGKAETKRCAKTESYENSLRCLKAAEQNREDFTEKYGQNLLAQFKAYQEKGFVELIPTAATYSYMPHYEDYPEVLNAQIETGIYSQKNYFGEAGEGFWIPYLGWAKGLEWSLRSYGMNYTVVDARSILFSKDCPDSGIFAPVRTRTSLVLFGKDPDTPEDICGEEGFAQNEVYLSNSHDIGFELEQDKIASFFGKDDARIQTGFQYWNNESEEDDLVTYDAAEAEEQTVQDAIQFYSSKLEKLQQAKEHMADGEPLLVCAIPARVLGQTWNEGIKWLENVFRCTASKQGFDFVLLKDRIAGQFTLPKIMPYPCSSNGLGYGEDLMDNSNSWMIRYVRKATERMVDLTDRFPQEDSLKERLLNMGAKQVLLAQSGQWAEMIHDGTIPEYVKEEFKNQILSFTKVFDALASNTVSTEWLTECEKKNALFPWLNYRVFARKK